MVRSPGRAALRQGRAISAVALAEACLVAGFAVVFVIAAASAAAHNALRSSTPAEGSRLDQVPRTVELVFDEPVRPRFTSVVVTGADGADVAAGDPVISDVIVTQRLHQLEAAGSYEIGYRVVSADGHPVSGTIAFTLTGVASEPAAASEPDAASKQAVGAPAGQHGADSGEAAGADSGEAAGADSGEAAGVEPGGSRIGLVAGFLAVLALGGTLVAARRWAGGRSRRGDDGETVFAGVSKGPAPTVRAYAEERPRHER